MKRVATIIAKMLAKLLVGAIVGLFLCPFLPGQPPPGVLESDWEGRRALCCIAIMAVVAVAAGHVVIKSPLKQVTIGIVCGASLGFVIAISYAKAKEVSNTTVPANDGKRRAGLQWHYIELAVPVCLPVGAVLGGITGYVVARQRRLTNGSSGDGGQLLTVS